MVGVCTMQVWCAAPLQPALSLTQQKLRLNNGSQTCVQSTRMRADDHCLHAPRGLTRPIAYRTHRSKAIGTATLPRPGRFRRAYGAGNTDMIKSSTSA